MIDGEDRVRDAVRRRMAELGIRDLAALSTRSGVPVRTINHMLAGKRSRSRYAVEVALGWSNGSIDQVAAGGEPEEATIGPDVPPSQQQRQVFLDVAEAIRQDAELLEDARQHLLRQYDLLVRLSRAERGERGGPPPPDVRGRDLTDSERDRLKAEEDERADRLLARRHGERVTGDDSVGDNG